MDELHCCLNTDVVVQVESCVNAVRSNPGQYASMCGASVSVMCCWSFIVQNSYEVLEQALKAVVFIVGPCSYPAV